MEGRIQPAAVSSVGGGGGERRVEVERSGEESRRRGERGEKEG